MSTIHEVKLKQKKIISAKAYVQVLQSKIDEYEIALQDAYVQMKKENKDVERLKKVSLASILLHFQQDKEERLAKEEKEALDAMVHVKQLEANLQALEIELANYQALIEEEQSVSEQLERLEYEYLHATHHPLSKRMEEVRVAIDENRVEYQELQEAIQSGKLVDIKLKEILKNLDNAGNWGMYDMLGGGVVSSIIKHEKIDKVQKKIADIQLDIQRFQKELRDVSNMSLNFIDISDSLAFFDIAFDNIFSDFMVQSRIQKVQKNVSQVQHTLESILKDLATYSKQNKDVYDGLKKEYSAILEQADVEK